MQTLVNAVKRLQKVQIKYQELFLTCLCRSVRKHKGHKALHRFVKYHTSQLDIRTIISNSIGLHDFFRCFLSEPQRALLAKQRSRIAFLKSGKRVSNKSERKSFDSDLEKPLSKFSTSKFEQAMKGFEPSNRFERSLVQGVLFRDGKVPLRGLKASSGGLLA